MVTERKDPGAPSKNEGIKAASNFLRGTILEGLADASTGAISEEDVQLLKFHGTYLQDDRDLRRDRRKHKLDKAYSFMVRVRVPGGVCTPDQWLALNDLSERFANGTLKLTTRQAFQFHGILKSNLRRTIHDINRAMLDTLAACGDVNRNVMCNPNPYLSSAHAETLQLARAIGSHLLPRTRAYHEIWVGDDKVAGGSDDDEEPIYGKYYLPRKFKIVIAVPPSNDVDVFAHDLGFVAIIEGERVLGYTVMVGGGMGMSHGQKETYPRLAEAMAFCTPEQAVDVAEKVLLVQRDFGDRSDRKHARLKYTIDDHGLAWFRSEVEKRLGYALEDPRPFHFDSSGDRYGWVEGTNGRTNLTLFIQNGRVFDGPGSPMKTGLSEIAKIHDGDFRLTPNQNLIIANISPEKRTRIEEIITTYKLDAIQSASGLRLNSMACVALPTCGLALAESERNLPSLIDELETVIEESGLRHDAIIIRNTGCPNGCARPYLGEIGLVGRAPGKYNIYLGAAFDGSRLNKLYRESVKVENIVDELAPIIRRYAAERNPGERFGDYTIRAGFVRATHQGRDFHE